MVCRGDFQDGDAVIGDGCVSCKQGQRRVSLSGPKSLEPLLGKKLAPRGLERLNKTTALSSPGRQAGRPGRIKNKLPNLINEEKNSPEHVSLAGSLSRHYLTMEPAAILTELEFAKAETRIRFCAPDAKVLPKNTHDQKTFRPDHASIPPRRIALRHPAGTDVFPNSAAAGFCGPEAHATDATTTTLLDGCKQAVCGAVVGVACGGVARPGPSRGTRASKPA